MSKQKEHLQPWHIKAMCSGEQMNERLIFFTRWSGFREIADLQSRCGNLPITLAAIKCLLNPAPKKSLVDATAAACNESVLLGETIANIKLATVWALNNDLWEDWGRAITISSSSVELSGWSGWPHLRAAAAFVCEFLHHRSCDCCLVSTHFSSQLGVKFRWLVAEATTLNIPFLWPLSFRGCHGQPSASG